jgi:hypothetical protein
VHLTDKTFFGMVDVLRLASAPGRVGEIIELLRQARPHADALRARLLDTPQGIPALDMLFPAIVQAVVYWSDGGTPVAVTHDEHSALTTERVAQLKDVLSERNQLTSLRRIDSRSDARVQVAEPERRAGRRGHGASDGYRDHHRLDHDIDDLRRLVELVTEPTECAVLVAHSAALTDRPLRPARVAPGAVIGGRGAYGRAARRGAGAAVAIRWRMGRRRTASSASSTSRLSG